MPRVLGESYGGGRFIMGEIPLYASCKRIMRPAGGTCTSTGESTYLLTCLPIQVGTYLPTYLGK